MARGLDLDLVEVAPMANPPVCRIMDYGKFRYEEAQKAKEARKKSSNISIKEVKFRPKIGKGDFDTKMRHLVEFIEDGHKVKVTLQFRGREMAHPELGRKILDDVIVGIGAIGKVENQARMEGRSMSMVIAPDKKAIDAQKKAASEAAKSVDTETTSVDTETTSVDTESTTVDTESTTVETEPESVETESTSVDTDAESEPADASAGTAEPPEEPGDE
jgi:translation initiation factor IF-3